MISLIKIPSTYKVEKGVLLSKNAYGYIADTMHTYILQIMVYLEHYHGYKAPGSN